MKRRAFLGAIPLAGLAAFFPWKAEETIDRVELPDEPDILQDIEEVDLSWLDPERYHWNDQKSAIFARHKLAYENDRFLRKIRVGKTVKFVRKDKA